LKDRHRRRCFGSTGRRPEPQKFTIFQSRDDDSLIIDAFVKIKLRFGISVGVFEEVLCACQCLIDFLLDAGVTLDDGILPCLAAPHPEDVTKNVCCRTGKGVN
jgi:hypothetical protein